MKHPVPQASKKVVKKEQQHRSIKPLKSRQYVNSKLSNTAPRFQMFVFVVICCALGISSSNLSVGQAAIGVYFVLSLIFRIKSQTTFTLALMSLITVPLLLLLQNKALSENFAVYAFLLLSAGLLSAIFEAVIEPKLDVESAV